MDNDFLPLASYLKDRFENFASTDLLSNAAGYSGTLASMKRNLERQAEELSKIASSFEAISENRKLPENTVTLLSVQPETN